MSTTIKKTSGVLIQSPKGYGQIRNNTKDISAYFTNAITIFGKKHLLNSLTSFLVGVDGNGETVFTNALPQITGISIMFRRCGEFDGTTSDPPTHLSHKLTKGFFEHIYGFSGGSSADYTHIRKSQQGKLKSVVSGATVSLELTEITPTVDVDAGRGCWGGATVGASSSCIDPTPNQVWPGLTTEGPLQRDQHQVLKDDVSNPGFGFAKIAGISLVTSEIGTYTGGNQSASTHNGNTVGNTTKVWRDPTYMELIHQQESLREYNNGQYTIEYHDTQDVTKYGHYFPTKAHFLLVNSAGEASGDNAEPYPLGDSHMKGSCSIEPGTNTNESLCNTAGGVWTPTHNIWEWKHTAIDTFAFSGFTSHFWGANQGVAGDEDGFPFKSLDLENRTASGSTYNGVGTLNHYIPIARQVGNFSPNFGYDFNGTVTWAWGDHDSTMTVADVNNGSKIMGGDGLLPDQLSGFEINYDKLDSQTDSEQDNFIDYNDTISTKYTINFAQSTGYQSALNTNVDTRQNNDLGQVSTTIETAVGEKWANDFGIHQQEQSHHLNEYTTPDESAIRGIRVFDKSGRIMMAKDSNGTDVPLGKDETQIYNYNNVDHGEFAVHELVSKTNLTGAVRVKTDTVQITNDMIFNPATNQQYIVDYQKKRPRILTNTLTLILNQLHASESTAVDSRKPHKIELYGRTGDATTSVLADKMFTFILGSSNFADDIAGGDANPFKAIDDVASDEVLSNMASDWTNGNHLEVALKLVIV